MISFLYHNRTPSNSWFDGGYLGIEWERAAPVPLPLGEHGNTLLQTKGQKITQDYSSVMLLVASAFKVAVITGTGTISPCSHCVTYFAEVKGTGNDMTMTAIR